MKKLFCVLFLLLILSVSAHAEYLFPSLSSFNIFSSMSVSDLLRGRNVINDELAKRGYSELTLEEGEHVVGSSIQPGVYKLTVTGENSGSAILYEADGKLIDIVSLFYVSDFHDSLDVDLEPVTVELFEGQVIRIMSGPITFCTYDRIWF